MAAGQKKLLVIISCVLLVALMVYLAMPTLDPPPKRTLVPETAAPTARPTMETVTLVGESFTLELAIDQEARARGLSRRDSIDPHGGMLFVFPRPAMQSFWMRHCTTDIDLFFLDADGVITALHEMPAELPQQSGESLFEYELRLPGYSSGRPAQFAIELAPGSIRRLGLQTGDRVDLDLSRLKAMAR